MWGTDRFIVVCDKIAPQSSFAIEQFLLLFAVRDWGAFFHVQILFIFLKAIFTKEIRFFWKKLSMIFDCQFFIGIGPFSEFVLTIFRLFTFNFNVLYWQVWRT